MLGRYVFVLICCWLVHQTSCKRRDKRYSKNYVLKFDGTPEEAKEYGETLDLTYKRHVSYYRRERPSV